MTFFRTEFHHKSHDFGKIKNVTSDGWPGRIQDNISKCHMGEGGGLKSDKISVSYYLNDHQFLSHNTGSYREEEALIVIIDVNIFVAVVVVLPCVS